MITWLQDLRYALRQLRKSPSFTVAAVLTLAMAIGANVVVFSVLNGVILRPLNVPQPESLYLLESASGKNTAQSYPDYLDFRDRNHSFDGLAHSEWVKWPSMQVTVRQLNGTSIRSSRWDQVPRMAGKLLPEIYCWRCRSRSAPC